MRIFISYASERQETAEHICAFLEAGGKKCWIAPRDIPAGSNYGEEIIKGIESSDALVLVFDKAANESQHVLREVERAVSRRLPIVVYRLDDTVPSKAMEYFLLSIQWLDAGEVSEQSLGKLESALERQLGTTRTEDDKTTVTDRTAYAGEATSEGNAMPEGINPHVKISLKKRLGILLAVMMILAVMIVFGAVQKGRDEGRRTNPAEAEATPGTVQNEAGEKGNVTFTVGDYVSFGRYAPGGKTAKDGEGEITWQVVDMGEEGTLLVATDILSIRSFDCAESGVFDRDKDGTVYDRKQKESYTEEQMREFRGSNDWETSDLRAWLNASGVVTYPGKAPQDTATDEHGNAYGAEAGFLTDFTKAEMALVEQSGNGVFLLTKEQVRKYALTGSLNPSAVPTEAAIAADETTWYRNYKDSGIPDYIWATATAAEESVCNIYYVNVSGAEETFGTLPAAAAGHGIRPALCIFPEEEHWQGDGSRQNPYCLTE
ncbi:MAG: toll/interleukin-1 receptor domain-containing protein [Lachnospiraceae bacterium]|nr:toll/interleukin-1 receptor domain-containing protein [Lachnospiraceae bacterium]